MGSPPVEMSAGQILTAYEDGVVHDDTAVRIQKDALPKPMRKYIRELVWMDYQTSSDPVDLEDAPRIYKTAFEKAPVALILSDLAGRILRANSAWCDMVGYTEDEVCKMRIGEFSPGVDRTEEIRLGNEVMSGKRASFQIEREYRAKDGRRVAAVLSVALVRDEEGLPSYVIGQVVDVTERKELQEELSRTERLRTVGRLAGGVAHDFNNLLTIIESEVEVLASDTTHGRLEAVSNVREAIGLSARLTQQLMAFSKEGAVSVETLDLAHATRGLSPIFQAAFSGRATFRFEGEEGEVLPIRANPILVEQAVMNLVLNARNALSDAGGVVSVGTRRSPDGFAVLEVVDNGRGMSPEVRKRAFEPFYTTRGDQGGTGLGLATVYGIVTRFGGTISLASKEGEGTQCVIRWPLVADDGLSCVPVTSESAQDAQNTSRSTRVLLVDDQQTIVRILERVLRRRGYEVVTAMSVADAVRAISGATDPFDLLLSDVMLPDGDGTSVADAARSQWPDLPVLFMSGYSADHVPQAEVTSEHIAFIQKPFTPPKLVAAIEALMAT